MNDIFRAVHTIKGNSGFFGYALLETACMGLESQLDRARKGEAPFNEALVNTVIEKVDQIRSAISTVLLVDDTGAPVLRDASPARDAAPDRAAEKAAEPKPDARAHRQAGGYRPLGEILVDMGAVGEDEVNRALAQQERPIGEILVESGSRSRRPSPSAESSAPRAP